MLMGIELCLSSMLTQLSAACTFFQFLGVTWLFREVNYIHTLDVCFAFYVNKYIDYHAFETTF